MTTAQLDHLKRIDAHLERLIETAKKRTPREWSVYRPSAYHPGIECDGRTIVLYGDGDDDAGVRTGIDDANFIASCAGNAEAGWIATRAAIAEIRQAHKAAFEGWFVVAKELGQEPGSFADYPLPPWSKHILAAFPLELLDS